MTKATTVFVYPSPDLLARVDGAHLPGVGHAGAEVPADLAAEWIAAGIATTDKPALDVTPAVSVDDAAGSGKADAEG